MENSRIVFSPSTPFEFAIASLSLLIAVLFFQPSAVCDGDALLKYDNPI
jgi:hypothetical protein